MTMVMVIMTTTAMMMMIRITFELDGSPLPREEDSEESERFEEEESSACCREELHEEEEEEQEVEGKEEVEEKEGLEEGWRRCLLSHVEPELMERSRGNSWRKQRILFQRVFGHIALRIVFGISLENGDLFGMGGCF